MLYVVKFTWKHSYGNFFHVEWGDQSVFLQHFPPLSCYHHIPYSPSNNRNKTALKASSLKTSHALVQSHTFKNQSRFTIFELVSLMFLPTQTMLWSWYKKQVSVTSLTFYLLNSQIFFWMAQEVLIWIDRKGCWGKIWWKDTAHHLLRS